MPRSEIRGVHMYKTIGGCLLQRTDYVVLDEGAWGLTLVDVVPGQRCVCTQVVVHAGADVAGEPHVYVGDGKTADMVATAALNPGDIINFGSGGSALLTTSDGGDLYLFITWAGNEAGVVVVTYSYILIPGV